MAFFCKWGNHFKGGVFFKERWGTSAHYGETIDPRDISVNGVNPSASSLI